MSDLLTLSRSVMIHVCAYIILCKMTNMSSEAADLGKYRKSQLVIGSYAGNIKACSLPLYY